MTNISVRDIAWLAGLLEGEGCFYLAKTPSITISMTDKDVIEKVASLFNREIYLRNHLAKKKSYEVGIYGSDAVAWMFTIYSFMKERRKERIRNIVKKWMTQNSHSKTHFSCGHPKSHDNMYLLKNRGSACITCHKVRRKADYNRLRK